MYSRKIAIVLLLSLFGVYSFAQENCKLRGEIRDSLNFPVYDASVSAFNEKNQGAGFTFTDVDGAFVLELPCKQTYEVEVEHVEYQSFSAKYTLEKSRSVKIDLKPSRVSLQEAVINAKKPITVKGDTIEYDADSFRTVADETLEDLLKKLPGLEVDNGKVYYEGKEIKSIKVGGREVLGGNTKLLTKNLPAEAIDKVQLNKKFKANPFSNSLGDDEEAILNIELKEEKKSIIFGNMTLGGDADEHSDVQSKLFYFSPKTDATSITDYNTYGKEVFSNEDYFTFLGGISEFMEEGSSFSLRNDPNRISLGTAQDAADMNAFLSALHFGYEPNKKWFSNGFVLFNNNNIKYKSTQERIGENLTYRDEQTNDQHLLSTLGRFRVDYTPDNRSQFKYRATFNYMENQNEQFADTYLNDVSTGKRENLSDRTSYSLRQSLSYIRKIGRNDNLGFYVRHQWNKETPELQINSDVVPLLIDGLAFHELNQNKKQNIQNLQLYGIYNHLLTYTSNLRLKAGVNFSWQTMDNKIYEGNNLIEAENFRTDSDFDYTETYVDLTYTHKLGIVKMDAGVGLHHFAEKTHLIDKSRSENFSKFLPHITFEIRPKGGHSVNLGYNLKYSLPNLTDLSDGYEIQNYYSIYRGFLGLKPAMYHNANLNYSYFNSRNFFNFYTGITYNRNVDNFQNFSDMTSSPQINSSINNVEDDQNLNLYFGASRRFTKNYSIRLNGNLNYMDYYGRIQRLDFDSNQQPILVEALSHNTSFTQSYTLTNSFKFKKKFEFDLGLAYSNNDFKSLTDNEFVTWRPFAKMAWSISDKLLLQSDYSYRIQYQNSELINENQALNASLRIHLMKNTYLTLIGGNLLGDDRLVSSSFNAQYNQTFVNTRELLGRYFLVQLRYRF